MKKIIIASHNPVKAQAVLNGFERMFPEEKFTIRQGSVSSGVSNQPMTDRDTLIGAANRAKNARRSYPDGDLWVGVEGGCDYLEGEMVAFAWIMILSEENSGSARTALFRLPGEVQKLVESGLELGDADDKIFGRENSKQKSGAVGILTGDVVTRTRLYEQAVILALIPFKNPQLY
ncbi:MAG: inosine/xanthosine triphosphatase [Chloroflexota bacterium]|jgi:inosine/xanthosine triphosphatase|nr:inosine/xanthosine triphosphatase [Chloroflexota bacterium]